jgi:hypothetical protein
MQYWKGFIFYSLRTGLLDEDVRQHHYGIKFTPTQLQIILQLAEHLEEYNDEVEVGDGGESLLESDQDSEEYLEEVDDDDDDNEEAIPHFTAPPDDDAAISDDDTRISLRVRVAEKLLQLSIECITQYLRQSGDEKNSPLMYFSSVLGIALKTGRSGTRSTIRRMLLACFGCVGF